MTASEVLEHLYSLDASSPDFLRVLYSLIRHDENEQYTSSLEGAELTRLVDFLDDTLGTIPASDDVFRQCLRKLRAICGYHTTLPSSHLVTGDLKRVGDGAIAFGGYADVWQGTHGDKDVCIKVLRVTLNDDESVTKSFFKEAVVWKRLRHPNVVPFLGVTNKPLQFVSEWMPNGTLTHYVRNNTGANRISLLLDVAEGLNYLHTSYTIHGDLKGPNILVDHDGHARLTDFGLTSIAHGINSAVTRAQGYTARWTAPEVLKGPEKTTREADIFSFGMVVTEVFTGRYPFEDLNAPSVMLKIMEGERPIRPRGTQELGLVDPLWGMTINCWQHDPAHRPTTARVVEFLRECYTLRAANKCLSTLPPWQSTGNTDDPTYHIAISPTSAHPSGTSQYFTQSHFQTQDTPTSPASTFNIFHSVVCSSSSGSSHGQSSDESRVLPNSASDTDTSHIPNVKIPDQDTHPGDALIDQIPQPKRSSTFDDIRIAHPMQGLFRTGTFPTRNDAPTGLGFKLRPGFASPKRQSTKEEKGSQKTGKGLWHGLAAAIRFKVFSKRTPGEHRGGG